MASKLTKIYRQYHLDYLTLFIIFIGYYGWRQWHGYLGDPDGFYHAKIAEFLRQGKLLTTMPWMQFSSLKNEFTDHQLLYHLILVPFTYIKGPLIGVKIATVFLAGLMGISFYWLLKKLHFIYPYWLTLALITLNGLNFRLTLVKTNSLSLILVWLLIYALFYHKFRLAFLIGWLFVLSYGGWPLALVILATFLTIDVVYHKFWQPKGTDNSNWKLSASLLGGLALGLVANPYWPQNLAFYYQQFIQIGVINFGNKFSVGGEWYGANLMKIISSAPHLFIAVSLIFLLLFFNWRLATKKTLFSFILTFGFLLLTVKSSRYIEYFLPFALLFAASGLTDLQKIISWEIIKQYWHRFNRYLKFYLLSTSIIFVIVIVPLIVKQMININTHEKFALNRFSGAGAWLQNNTPAQSIIFHSNWDDWPMLFYYNDQNYYLVGLDQTFMYNFDQELNQLYVEIINGKVKENLVDQIKNKFQTEFVLLEKDNEKFLTNIEADAKAELVYQDEQINIYKLN